MNVLVLHGPNLNLLGERRPELYGRLTLAELDERLHARARELGLSLRIFQSNHEGALLDRLHAERDWMDALVINPGAYTHTSYALRDGIEAVDVRAVEVHLTDIHARESFRARSVIADVCERQIAGKGAGSYLEALTHLAGAGAGGTIDPRTGDGSEPEPVRPRERRLSRPPSPNKTIGRAERPRPGPDAPGRPPSATPAPKREPKTLGRAPVRERPVSLDEPTREAVRERIRARLAGRLSATALADWAKGRLLALARADGVDPAEHARLEDALLRLSLAGHGRGLSDVELVELLAALG